MRDRALRQAHRELPLYTQIAAAIRREIVEGHYPPDSKLPSEAEMVRMFRVARATVRQALARLIQEGLVYSRRAVGYFVAAPRVEQDLDRLFGFSEFMVQQGARPSSRLLEARVEKISAVGSRILAALHLKVGEPVIFLRRLRLANHEPLVIAGTYLPEKLFPGFLEQDIEGRSVYDIMGREYGRKPDEAIQTFEGITLPKPEAKIFGLSVGAPALLIERVGYSRGIPVEYAVDYYRGDRTKFRVRLADQLKRAELKALVPQRSPDVDGL